ncbi:MAG: GNAT family N-acetyltransferase [Trueperaceae bacterium]
MRTRSATTLDAPLVHELYAATPAYFEIISIPVPTLQEVATDIATAIQDPRRFVEIVLLEGSENEAIGAAAGCPSDPITGQPVAGYLDYKLDYPQSGDATVNLLLIRHGLQNYGVGTACAEDLERRLAGRAQRMLASIYGDNPRARTFWERLGYKFAIDAKPLLEWYAKQID